MIENLTKWFCILNKFFSNIFILGCFILLFNLTFSSTINGSISQISSSDTTITVCGKILEISRIGIKSNYPNGKWSITEGPAINISGNTFYATFSELKSGSNTFIWTADNNQEKITLRVLNNQPIARVYKPTSIICGTQLVLKSENPQKYLPLAKGRWISSKQPIENKDSLAFLNNNQIISTNKDTVSTLSYNLKVTGAYSFVWMVTHPDCPSAKDSIQIINRRNIAEIVTSDNANALTCGILVTVSTKNIASFSKPTWIVKKVPEIGVQEPVFTKLSTTSTTINWKWSNFTKPGSYDLLYIVRSENALECPSDTQSFSILNIKPLAELEYTSQFVDVCGKTQLKAKKPSLSGAGLSGKWILDRKPLNAANINTDNLQYNSSVNFTKPGSYYFKWYVQKDSPICTSDTALIIFNNIKPSIVNAGKDSIICSNIYDLKATDLIIEQLPNTRGYWSIYSQPAQNTKVVFDDSSRARAIVKNLNKIGSYGFVWNVVTSTSTLSSCINSDSVMVTSYLHPEFINTDIKYFCDTLQLFNPRKEFPSGNIIPTENWKVSENYNLGNYITIYELKSNEICASGFTKPGIYKFDYTFSYGGCETKTTFTSQNLKPSPFLIGNKGREFCTDSIKLTAPLVESGFVGQWKSIPLPNMPLPVFANSSLVNTYVKGFNKPGAYKFQWVVSSPLLSSPVCSRGSDTITFYSQKASVLPLFYKTDTNFCGTAFTLNIPKLDEGFLSKNSNWSILSLESETIKKTIIGDVITYSNILRPGKIKLVWFLANTLDPSCIRRDTIVRTSQQPNVVNAAGQDMEVCGKNDVVSMKATTNPLFPLTKVKWNVVEKPKGANFPTFLGDSSDSNLKLSGFNKTGTYRFTWTQTNFGCSETDEIKIINKAPDTIFARSINKFTCKNSDTLIGYNPIGIIDMKDAKYKWRILNQPAPTTDIPTKAVITDILSPTTTITGMSNTGIYRIVYLIQNSSCIVSDTVTINRSNTFASVPKINYHTCEDSLIIYSDPTEASGWSWDFSRGALEKPILLDKNNPNKVLVKGFSVAEKNEYIWMVKVPGCISSVSVFVYKYPKFSPISFSKKVIKICESDTITLQPILRNNNTMVAEWYRKDTLFSNKDNPKIEKLKYGESVYKFRWIQPFNACFSNFDNLTIVRDSGFQPSINLKYDKILCYDSQLVSSDTIFNAKYKWVASSANPYPINPLRDTLSKNSLYFFDFEKPGLYKIFLEISRGACVHKDTVIIDRKNLASPAQILYPKFDKDTICEQEAPYKFIADKPTGGSIGYWVMNKIADITDTSTTKIVQFIPGKINEVIWVTTNNGFCPSQDGKPVYVTKKPPTPYAGENFTTYATKGKLNAKDQSLSPTDNAQWTTSSNNNILIKETNNPKSEFSNLPIGENKFFWKISNAGCPIKLDTIIITRLQSQIPKAFSPNNDDKNDSFFIVGIEDFQNSELQVFNRWGDLVYENKNYNNEWKGESKNGKFLPDDTYYYVLKLGEDNEAKNFVIIKR